MAAQSQPAVRIGTLTLGRKSVYLARVLLALFAWIVYIGPRLRR